MAKPTADQFWRIPRIWPDRTVYILGGGPSLKDVNVEALKGERVIATNNAYRLADWIDVVTFVDTAWLEWHESELKSFGGLKISSAKAHLSGIGPRVGVKVVNSDAQFDGLSASPGVVALNKNSGAFAINVATLLGAKRIVLLGFDMKTINGRHNWHKDHKRNDKQDPKPYDSFLPRFPAIARDLARMGVQCVNATPGSALTVFPIVHPAMVMPPVDWSLFETQEQEAIVC